MAPEPAGAVTAPVPPPDARARRYKQIAPIVLDFTERLLDLVDTPTPVAGLQLTPADCRTLETTTGIGTTHSVADLVRAVERLASISVGDIRLEFTPGQLHELKHRATKRGRTLAEEMRAVVARIEDELFYKGG